MAINEHFFCYILIRLPKTIKLSLSSSEFYFSQRFSIRLIELNSFFEELDKLLRV